jgi:hypothetical protein
LHDNDIGVLRKEKAVVLFRGTILNSIFEYGLFQGERKKTKPDSRMDKTPSFHNSPRLYEETAIEGAAESIRMKI